ncbi:DUF4269 domain-containing protein [Mucilaginibacter lacusdianchii]|uniref:DUF4269 domain-containing protein n=1 Tax=Mucilaginibacter lacusdianchii TaxID=2684211 RepID=UPI00131D4387|nr:DUF4269 domain-containing protein [Mucilaginibacter sp. JXJ CY 39]
MFNAVKYNRIDYLHDGNADQQEVYHLLKRQCIMEKLAAYHPLLVGTVPLVINISGSDLDIICDFERKEEFKADVLRCFSTYDNFELAETVVNGEPTIIASMVIDGWPVELFGQYVSVKQQAAYRHMLVGDFLLRQHGDAFKKQVISLKQQGVKTEPAFAYLLNLEGNAYELLLHIYDSNINEPDKRY